MTSDSCNKIMPKFMLLKKHYIRLKLNKNRLFEWPACLSNLNPIENFWGILIRRLYCISAIQYSTVTALKVTIAQSRDNIKAEVLHTFTKNMQNNDFKVICRNGKATLY